ncbi:hypothetical protein AAG565_08755 [Fontimonas sp. SYSU GA230001]|uniref:hypothetical protein n=1 Tax=Fontimonas sp. SYSU GA230001 TaxID=3142450 RepID=UPI0032B50F16
MKAQGLAAPLRSVVLASSFGAVLALAACGGGGGGGGDNPIPLSDPNAVMASLATKVTSSGAGVQYVTNSTPPAPTPQDPETPKAEAGVAQSTAVPGDTISLPVNVSGGQQLTNLFAKVPGASSYFNAQLTPSGGKSMVRLHQTSAKTSGSFVAVQLVDFRIELPANLQTGGEFCLDFTVKTATNQVTVPTRSCVTVVAPQDRPAQTADDQPAANQLGNVLAGDWVSECFDIDDFDSNGDGVNDVKAAKVGVGFGAGSTYTEFIQIFGTDVCSDAAQTSPFVDGTYSAGASAYNPQTRLWQRPFDFLPDDPNSIGFLPCYNLLRLADNNATLLLGIPLTFQFDDGENPQEGDCKSQDTRPTTVITSLPFTR